MEPFTILPHIEDLDQESRYLVHKARDAASHAYAPYSKFQVGAAVMLRDGSVVTGTNQENAAYPSGMCAERVALYAAVAAHPDAIVSKIAIVAKRKGGKEIIPATACGACRQVMLEIEIKQKHPIEVVMQNHEHQWVKANSAASLSPVSFTRMHLEGGH